MVRPAVKQVQIVRWCGTGPRSELVAKTFIHETKLWRFLFLQHGDRENNLAGPVGFDRVFVQRLDHSVLTC